MGRAVLRPPRRPAPQCEARSTPLSQFLHHGQVGCVQASSVGVRCQLMPARMPLFASAGKPRGGDDRLLHFRNTNIRNNCRVHLD